MTKRLINVFTILLLILSLFSLSSCNSKETEEEVVHVHNYTVNEEGTYICNEDNIVYENTDSPYIAVLDTDTNLPTNIIPLTNVTETKVNVGNGTVYKKDNITYYTGNNAQTVIIKTTKDDKNHNDELVINAPNDDVYLYGSSTIVDLEAVALSSCHLNAAVELVTLTNARLVLEANAQVKEIYLDTSNPNYSYDKAIIALSDGAELPNLTRGPITLQQGQIMTLAVVEILKTEVNTKDDDTKETETTVDETAYVKIMNIEGQDDDLVVGAFLSNNPDEDNVDACEIQTVSTNTLEQALPGSTSEASKNTFVDKTAKVVETEEKIIEEETKKEEEKKEEEEPTPTPTPTPTPSPTPTPEPEPEPEPTPTHTHSYGAWYDLDDSYHAKKCSCGDVKKEAHSLDASGICTVCHHGAEVSINDGSNTTYATLSQFRDNVNNGNNYAGYTITLLKDVDLNNEEWTPISNYAYGAGSGKLFAGTFDGNNHTISNFKVTNNKKDVEGNTSDLTAGLFGNIATCTIKNLKISNVTISNGGGLQAALCGLHTSANSTGKALFENIEILSGSVTSSENAGGLVAYCTGYLCLSNCINKANITGYNPGGIAGVIRNDNKDGDIVIDNCINYGVITDTVGDGNGAAGIVGKIQMYTGSNVIIKNCTNKGNVVATQANIFAGGIIGKVNSSGGETQILYCINTGNITSNLGVNAYAGGMYAEGGDVVKISYCINTGDISGYAGASGIAATSWSGNTTTNYCYNSGKVVSINTMAVGLAPNGGDKTNNSLNSGIIECTNGTAYDICNKPNATCYYYDGSILKDSLGTEVTDIDAAVTALNVGAEKTFWVNDNGVIKPAALVK